jgi:hypothetical protein
VKVEACPTAEFKQVHARSQGGPPTYFNTPASFFYHKANPQWFEIFHGVYQQENGWIFQKWLVLQIPSAKLAFPYRTLPNLATKLSFSSVVLENPASFYAVRSKEIVTPLWD